MLFLKDVSSMSQRIKAHNCLADFGVPKEQPDSIISILS